MFRSITSFYEVFGESPPSYIRYRDFYYLVPDRLEEVVVQERSFRGAGVLLGEKKDKGFVPSLSSLERLEDCSSVNVDREDAWWFTTNKTVEIEDDRSGHVLVCYEGAILGVGRFSEYGIVPVFDVGYFLRGGY